MFKTTEKDKWVFLDARETFHRVTEVTGYRLSIIHHTPQHSHRLSGEDWEILRDTGFPVDAVWEQGITNQDESDDESSRENEVNEVIQPVDTPKTLSRQTSTEETQGPLMELDESLNLPWSALRPTMQAILWLSDLVARCQLRPDVIPGANPKLHRAMATMEIREMDNHLQKARQANGIDSHIGVHHKHNSDVHTACSQTGGTMSTWCADPTPDETNSRNGRRSFS